MNYSPDYNMRRRTQDCGCSRNMTWDRDPHKLHRKPEYARNISVHTADCGCTEQERVTDTTCTETTCHKCMRTPDCIDTFPVGMTYTPWQVWQELYEIDEALKVGTIFRELNYPWEVGKCAGCR